MDRRLRSFSWSSQSERCSSRRETRRILVVGLRGESRWAERVGSERSPSRVTGLANQRARNYGTNGPWG